MDLEMLFFETNHGGFLELKKESSLSMTKKI